MDKRFYQAHQEARWSFALGLLYLASWIVTAWQGGEAKGITGLPRWFELSCLYVPLLFFFLCWLMIAVFFRDIPLEDHHGN